MKLLTGLGNPGSKYEKNRHNIGFMALDEIEARSGIEFGPWRGKFQGLWTEGKDARGEKCFLLKPQTYMNESGRAVAEAARFYKIKPRDIIVFHDELDLQPGKMKVKVGGGHAGHNGLRSIMSLIGADFQRVRIGIGHPGRKELVAGYVLHDFSKADQQWVEELLEGMARNLEPLIVGEAPRFMSDVARFMNPQRPSSGTRKPEAGQKKQQQTDVEESIDPKKTSGNDFKDVLGNLKDRFKK